MLRCVKHFILKITGHKKCIACGEYVKKENAREYDKHGDRWERENKQFEYLCKTCYKECGKYEHNNIENKLMNIENNSITKEQFIQKYIEEIEDEN